MSQLTIEVILFVLLTILGFYFIYLYNLFKSKKEDYKEKAILDVFSFLFICFGILILFSNTVNLIKYLIILKYGN